MTLLPHFHHSDLRIARFRGDPAAVSGLYRHGPRRRTSLQYRVLRGIRSALKRGHPFYLHWSSGVDNLLSLVGACARVPRSVGEETGLLRISRDVLPWYRHHADVGLFRRDQVLAQGSDR
jgi:hypothetical protein